jgi:hypothetical protein
LDLTPDVTVVVHPVDTTVHSTYPEGYRWAVMVGGVSPTVLEYCANAGHCPTVVEAAFTGSSAAAPRPRRCGCSASPPGTGC